MRSSLQYLHYLALTAMLAIGAGILAADRYIMVRLDRNDGKLLRAIMLLVRIIGAGFIALALTMPFRTAREIVSTVFVGAAAYATVRIAQIIQGPK